LSTETPSLSLVGVSKSWPGRDRAVLDDVSLTLQAGSAVRVGGANGAGKTTLLRIAAGLIRPEAGRIRLGVLDVEDDRTAFQRCVGFLSAASAGLYARLTVRDHLRLWSRLALLEGSARAASCERVLDALGLRPLADRRVDRLSMGQRQRVRLAGAFLHDPRVVMLDEPTTSLDDEGTGLLVAEVDRVRRAGGIALWCAPTTELGTSLDFDHRLVLRDAQLHDEP
jgi:ABC-type multidrug transport system ATPase subunit